MQCLVDPESTESTSEFGSTPEDECLCRCNAGFFCNPATASCEGMMLIV